MIVEACIRVVDKIGTTPFLDGGLTKAGDVIEVLPAFSDWGDEILNGEPWRIVRVDLLVTTIDALLEMERGVIPPERLKFKRWNKVDYLSMPPPRRNALLASNGTVLDLTGFNIEGYVQRKIL